MTGTLSGFLCTHKYLKDTNKTKDTQENLDIKESPYTLEELLTLYTNLDNAIYVFLFSSFSSFEIL